jgi:hypothetical protein
MGMNRKHDHQHDCADDQQNRKERIHLRWLSFRPTSSAGRFEPGEDFLPPPPSLVASLSVGV